MVPSTPWRAPRDGESNRLPARSLPHNARAHVDNPSAGLIEAVHFVAFPTAAGVRDSGTCWTAEAKFLMTEDSSFPSSAAVLRISVVVPARNEAGNITPLV